MTPKINAALLKAQSAVQALAKDGDNKHHNYFYTTSEAVIDEGRRALNGAGLTLDETATACEWDRSPPIMSAKYTLSHESGEDRQVSVDWPVIESKGRPLDKALAGAKTVALAYVLRGLLLIPRSDNIADMNKRDDRDHEPQHETAAQPSKNTRQFAVSSVSDDDRDADEMIARAERFTKESDFVDVGEEIATRFGRGTEMADYVRSKIKPFYMALSK